MRLPFPSGPLAIVCALLLPAGAAGQSGANVAVVINESSSASVTVGEYYAVRRSLPNENVIRIKVTPGDTISRAAYAAGIEAPVAQALAKAGLQDRILFIVLTKGIPLRILGTTGPYGSAASVDSELTLLYRRMTGRPVPPGGPLENPFFAAKADPAAKPFTHKDHDIYLVTRLDGPTVEDARQLVDRGSAAEAEGAVYFDQRGEARSALADRWMADAADAITNHASGATAIVEPTPKPVTPTAPALGYFSWGGADPAVATSDLALEFAPGGIAATLGSGDGRTLEPPAKGRVSIGGALVKAGAAGVGVNVSEPLLQSSFRPQILFPAYLGGSTLAEAFYRSLPHLSWQSIVIGDPLLRPFGKSVALVEMDPPVNETTGMPEYFSARRLQSMRADMPNTPAPALEQMMAAESHAVRDERDRAVRALTRAAELAPETAIVHLRLAALYEEANDKVNAATHYRRVIDLQPRNVVALNNLAFALSAAAETRDEAFEFASRAYALAPADGTIIDTLGWIEHLRGNGAEAARLIRIAAQRAPQHAEIRLHAAVVLAASGTLAEARPHLEAALKLDPLLAERDDVKELQQKLQK